MILETIFSTVDDAGVTNFAPMGIAWDGDRVVVRPYLETRTARNLALTRCGVASLSDDVLAYVECGLYGRLLPHFPARKVRGVVYRDTCSWLELETVSRSGQGGRLEIGCRVAHRERLKDFLGFCRARNAVIEAAVLASRAHLFGWEEAEEKVAGCRETVLKTGSEREREAFGLVWDYIRERGKHD